MFLQTALDSFLVVGDWILWTLFWLAFSYVVISLSEYFSHRYLMHRPTWLSRTFKFFRLTLEEHRDYHHGTCFSGRKFTAGAEDECLVINIDIKPIYGLLASCFIWIPLLFVSLHGAVVFVLLVLLHNSAWGVIHRQMHKPPAERAHWFKRSRLCLWLARYHCLHHIYPRCNHSVLFVLPDALFGTLRKPTAKDVATMTELGLYKETKVRYKAAPIQAR